MTTFVQLSAPYLMRGLMFGRAKVQGRSKPHIKVVNALQSVDQLFSVQLRSNASQRFDEYFRDHVPLERHIIRSLARKIFRQCSFVIEDRSRVSAYRRDNLGNNYSIRKLLALQYKLVRQGRAADERYIRIYHVGVLIT